MLEGVQVLRAVAAAMVVFHHFVSAVTSEGWVTGAWIQTSVGNAGVDLFFVISGFIMAYTVERKGSECPVEAQDFLVRRFIRIVPLLWVMIAGVVGLQAVVGPGGSLRVDGLRIVMSALLLPDPRSPMGAGAYLIPMAWSLTYEAYFYGLFALSLRLSALQRWAVLGLWFGLWTTLGLFWQPQAPMWQVLIDSVLWEFWAGMGLALMHARSWRMSMPWAVVCGLGAVGWLYADPAATWGVRWWSWGVPAVLTVAAVVLSGKPSGASTARGRGTSVWRRPLQAMWRWAVRGGDWSYALYLTHLFVLSAWVRVGHRWGADMGFDRYFGLYSVAFAVAAVGLAAASFYGVEQPLRRRLTRRWDAVKRRGLSEGGGAKPHPPH